MNKKKLLRLILILIPCVIIDQITKYIARTSIKVKSISIINNVLEFQYLENRGAVWGSFQGQITAFVILTILLSALLLWAYFKIPDSRRLSPISYLICFIIAGAIGNFIDRVTFGFVIDFIYFKIINFPIFNVADIYVTCSTILLAILVLFYYKDEDFEWLKFKKNNSGDE